MPISFSFGLMKLRDRFFIEHRGRRTDRGRLLLALPPPLAMKRNVYSSRLLRGVGQQVDLGRQIGRGVFLLEHLQRGDLRVAEVFFLIGVEDAGGEGGGIVAVGQHVLAFFAHDDGGAGVLAGGQMPGRGDHGILQMGVDDEAIVVGGFGVFKLFAQLGKMSGAKKKGDVAKRFPRREDADLRKQRADTPCRRGREWRRALGSTSDTRSHRVRVETSVHRKTGAWLPRMRFLKLHPIIPNRAFQGKSEEKSRNTGRGSIIGQF